MKGDRCNSRKENIRYSLNVSSSQINNIHIKMVIGHLEETKRERNKNKQREKYWRFSMAYECMFNHSLNGYTVIWIDYKPFDYQHMLIRCTLYTVQCIGQVIQNQNFPLNRFMKIDSTTKYTIPITLDFIWILSFFFFFIFILYDSQ